ncbi:GMC family oxidoreductase [Nocardia farcinica]|uniref:GMC family oxidoreductase n=1 Tax=Nocardia farcinica TaxID=37329 RepID=UPI00189478E9|nr:GMC family oxidoreductase [Nocardia farcinica]MBF6421439.1 GMC family oxidoreductase [Nocardia farcinica]MBF6433096.1 GMC family oxidoreductase [Nocardia farcinica]MBF6503914.1 GMC family oxidoreductase [Nocardia farcinica]MBF6576129.1 GMC family oxidoreductase [Nocardia farcinica]MCZ9328161.1 GMC family oxidoreductase [Nocardia farcinica]
MTFDYDVVVVGSGFGGSVTALRLTEKGYRVGVLEAGRRFADEEFAETSWDARKYLWAPALGCFGIQRLTLLKDTFIMAGAGVGGGSLVYANTLYEPPDKFYRDRQWAHITDWKAELAPHYDQAKRMLGVTTNPATTPSDRVLAEVAEEMGVAESYRSTPVGVLFGGKGVRPGENLPDPFFGGVGPARATCTHCGECMTGCRHNAKNTLVKNYLYLAEQAGATVHPLTTVTDVRPRPGGGYTVSTVRTGRWVRKARRTFTAEQVVFAAAALGTQKLLHKLRERGSLPDISPRLGELSRTNSEELLSVRSRRKDSDFTKGVAITSSIHPDDDTHIEPVRYGKGSNAIGLIGTAMIDPDGRTGKVRLWARTMRRLGLRDALHLQNPRGWSEQMIGLLVMQSVDNSITTYTKRGLFGRTMTTRQGAGEPNPTWIPAGHEVAHRVADKIDGIAGAGWSALFDIPMTGHFIGGCVIGDSPDTGVVDPYHRMYGYRGLHVIDGSTISANLGVNPSLTITAQAERAVALWPNKGEADPRPEPGQPYRRIAPVPPRNPVVPANAPAALRLPIVEITGPATESEPAAGSPA